MRNAPTTPPRGTGTQPPGRARPRGLRERIAGRDRRGPHIPGTRPTRCSTACDPPTASSGPSRRRHLCARCSTRCCPRGSAPRCTAAARLPWPARPQPDPLLESAHGGAARHVMDQDGCVRRARLSRRLPRLARLRGRRIGGAGCSRRPRRGRRPARARDVCRVRRPRAGLRRHLLSRPRARERRGRARRAAARRGARPRPQRGARRIHSRLRDDRGACARRPSGALRARLAPHGGLRQRRCRGRRGPPPWPRGGAH